MALSTISCVWRVVENKILKNVKYLQKYFKPAGQKKTLTNSEAYATANVADSFDASIPMELDLLERRIRRLVYKLKKHEVNLEVFDHEDIEYGRVLGKGGEGEVRKCIVRYNDVPVEAAVKMVLDSSDDAISITLDEIELLCLARDPIINTTVQVYGVAAVPDDKQPDMGHLVIVTEAGLMNALQLYQQENLPLSVTFDLWKRLAAAMHTMHTRKIIHHDLKPENILITALHRDKSGDIEKIDFKIIDLGMGKRLLTERVVTDDILGTKGYHAPEILFEDGYDFRADIFMLGITFCVMLHTTTFLQKKTSLKNLLKDIHEAKQKKLAGQRLFEKVILPSYDVQENIPRSIIDMICDMLEKQSKRHISLLDVISTCNAEATLLSSKRSRPPARATPDSGIDSSCRMSGPNRRTKRPLRTRQRSSYSCSESDVSTGRPMTRSSSKTTKPQNTPTATTDKPPSSPKTNRELKSILTTDVTLRAKRTRSESVLDTADPQSGRKRSRLDSSVEVSPVSDGQIQLRKRTRITYTE